MTTDPAWTLIGTLKGDQGEPGLFEGRDLTFVNSLGVVTRHLVSDDNGDLTLTRVTGTDSGLPILTVQSGVDDYGPLARFVNTNGNTVLNVSAEDGVAVDYLEAQAVSAQYLYATNAAINDASITTILGTTLRPAGAAFVGAVVKGQLNQTADLAQYRTSADVVQGSVRSDGCIVQAYTGTDRFRVLAANGTAILNVNSTGSLALIRPSAATSGSTSNAPPLTLQSSGWNGAASEVVAYITNSRQGGGGASARLTMGETSNPDLSALAVALDGSRTVSVGLGFGQTTAQLLAQSTDPARVTMVAQGAATQSADVFRALSSAGTVLASIGSVGGITAPSLDLVPSNLRTTITATTPSTQTAQLFELRAAGATGGASAQMRIGAVGNVRIFDFSNGSSIPQVSGTTTTQLELGASNNQTTPIQTWGENFGQTYRVVSQVNANGTLTIAPTGATTPLVILKAPAAQALDLQQWQSSAGAALLAVTVAGLPKWAAAANAQTTVGAAGAASAPPATPVKWLKVVDSAGTTLVIPAYNA